MNVRLEEGSSTSISLINRVRFRDQMAWQRLTHLYTPIVYQWVQSSKLSEEDIADIVQEVFHSVAKSLDDFGRDGKPTKFRAWLWGITRHRLLDHFRAVKDRPKAVGGDAMHDRLSKVPFEPPTEASDESQALTKRALELIKADFQEKSWQAFWRVTVEEQSAKDVAKDLGMSIPAVYTAKSRVLSHLRTQLDGLN